MEAYPAAVSFQWFFNSSEYEEWKGHEEFSQTGLKSELEFLPKSSKDYGSLFCIGENAIGRQEEACVFQVKNFPDFLISGFLDPVSDCANGEALPPDCLPDCQQDPHLPQSPVSRRWEVSPSNLKLISGFDGGLPANFLLELYDAEKMELKSQVTNKVPIFEVNIKQSDQ